MDSLCDPLGWPPDEPPECPWDHRDGHMRAMDTLRREWAADQYRFRADNRRVPGRFYAWQPWDVGTSEMHGQQVSRSSPKVKR